MRNAQNSALYSADFLAINVSMDLCSELQINKDFDIL